MNENKQKIRERCIEANPEILAPKFGCEISGFRPEIGRTFLLAHQKTSQGNYMAVFAENWEAECEHPMYTKAWKEPVQFDFKVIGRPIRLADVLVVLLEFFDLYEVHEVIENWDLKNDNLDLQTEKTIEYIASRL
jgi:hypothetical protein